MTNDKAEDFCTSALFICLYKAVTLSSTAFSLFSIVLYGYPIKCLSRLILGLFYYPHFIAPIVTSRSYVSSLLENLKSKFICPS